MPEPLDQNAELKERVGELVEKLHTARRRFLFAGQRTLDDKQLNAFRNSVDEVLNQVASEARKRLVAKLRWTAGKELDEEARRRFEEAIAHIENAILALEGRLSEAGDPNQLEHSSSPTIQLLPPPGLEPESDDPDALYRKGAAATWEAREQAWREHASELYEGRSAAAKALENALFRIWRQQAEQFYRARYVDTWIETWAKRLAHDEGVMDAQGHERKLWARLYALSTPACPLEEAALDREDTIAKIVVVVGPFKTVGEAQRKLSIPGPCALIETRDPQRVAVMQTWYAFPSYAIEGMETLRRSYLHRDRRNSLPHIVAEWNRHGLPGRDDLTARFRQRDLLCAARALALSHFLVRNGPAEDPLPGLRLLTGEPSNGEPPYFLRYTTQGGRACLVARRWQLVDGYVDTFRIGPEPVLLGDGAGRTPDLARDLGQYLSSPLRHEHELVLRALEPTSALTRSIT